MIATIQRRPAHSQGCPHMPKMAFPGYLVVSLVACVGGSAAWAADPRDPGTVGPISSPVQVAQAPAAQPPPATPEQPAAPTAMTTPAMSGPLAANPAPFSIDAGPLGPVYVTGVLSGLGLTQTNRFAIDHDSIASLSNGQVFIQKTDGIFQYFVQVGAYTLPALGAPYFNTGKFTGDFYGPLPQAFLKIAPNDNFSVQLGKLPTLIGAEYTFSFRE